MKPLRKIEVGLFMGVLFLLGVIGENSVAHAQQYLGCWKDDSSRVLENNQGSTNDMTNSKCIATCREKGFSSAGTQYYSYCFCGNNYDRLGKLEESQCNTPCSGNGAEMCGGAWANSVYSTGLTTPPQQANRPPNAPTLLSPPNTWSPPLNPSSITFQWRDNGDPDGDPVSFYLQIYIYNSTSKQWSPVYNDWVNGTSFTLTSFQPGSYYAWRVFAADTAQRSNPWYTASDWYYFSTVAAAQPQALNPWDTAQGQGCFEQWIAYAMSRLNSYNGSANFNACKPYSINKYGIWEGRGGQSFCFISASAPDSFPQYNNNKYWWIWDHYVPNPYWQVAEWNGAQIEGVRTYVTRCLGGG